ncbi:threonine-phosphate decarboxylase CobD [Paenibacillus urinalis]|uniref:threonine-phosphate decarboxylase CobD n=1 Tax=Paenibacillus urinalis TaxID=521520 RepID=UPI00363802ED
MIEVYGHGGDVETAAVKYGRSPADFLDYSANINPLGPPTAVTRALTEGMHHILRYPDPGHRSLKHKLAAKLKLSEDQLLIGNGAAECMALIIQAFTPAAVGTIEPGFSEYRQLAVQYGSRTEYIYGHKELYYRAELTEILELIDRVELLFIGQPNNPNGVQYARRELEAIAAHARDRDVKVVIDEAFIDFIPDHERETLTDSLDPYPNVIVIRSMTKFYAIPGLRLGYAVGHPDLISAMSSKQVTWSVNGLALLAGEACLMENSAYEEQTQACIKMERNRLMSELASLGFQVYPGVANYLLLETPEGWNAESLQEAMGKQGILIRNCAMYTGLGDKSVRIAVKGQQDNSRFLEVLRFILREQ